MKEDKAYGPLCGPLGIGYADTRDKPNYPVSVVSLL
jgi:hypothetical protein